MATTEQLQAYAEANPELFRDPDTLARMAGYLWDARWEEIAVDMNGDGSATISDVGLWVVWAFFLPGDAILIGLMAWLPSVALFLEIGPSAVGSTFAAIISGLLWLVVLSEGF